MPRFYPLQSNQDGLLGGRDAHPSRNCRRLHSNETNQLAFARAFVSHSICNMSEQESDPTSGAPEFSPGSSPEPPASRRKPLTPELRKFLGPGRSWHDREAAKEAAEDSERQAETAAAGTPMIESEPQPSALVPDPDRTSRAEPRRRPPPTPSVVPDQKISRAHEMQTVALIVCGFILLGAVFYAGTKARYLRALVASKNKTEIPNVDLKKYPGLTADELVEQALAAERLGQWHDAVERLLLAKRRNSTQHGLVFHAAKLAYDHGDFDGADLLLERAIAFGEQVDTANYLRGLIASGRNDLATAEQFFHAAIDAEPFTPGYYYYLADTLRKQHRSKEAATRFEQAANRTVNEQDALLCRFKARLAKVETADAGQLQSEIDQKRSAGRLTLDWALTEAALKIRAGESGQAAELIRQARVSDQASLPTAFASFTADTLFTDAATRHAEIAEAIRLGGSAPAGPAPEPTP